MRRLSLLTTLLMLVACAWAQTPTGTIEGTVQDPQGASIAGASVTITNQATGVSKQVKSDASGRIQIPFLLPGTYKVTVEAAGFRPVEQTVLVEVAQVRSLSFALSLGKTSESIEVQAAAPVLDTQTSSLGETVQTKTISDLPLSGRNPLALATLVPTVVDDSGNAPIPHIGGGRDSTSEVQIDGMSDILPENNVGDNVLAYRPIVDSVQEFNVQTNVLPAEFGRFSGGTISLVTKSGTNNFHGTGFLFAENGVLNALSYFSAPNSPKADTHQYQSGGTIGGPVPLGRSHKTFFFFAYENSQASNAGQETDTLPDPAWYSGATAGDFSALIPAGTDCNVTPVSGCIYDPTTVDPVTKKRLAFPGNIIPAARLNNPSSQIAETVMSYYPAPNASGNGFNYTIVGAAPNTYSHWDARIDHDFRTNWHSFLKVSHYDDHSLGGNALADYGDTDPASQGYGGPDHSGAWTASFNNTVTFSPTLLGEFRYGVSRSTEKRVPSGGNFDPSTLGFPSYVSAVAGPQGQVFPRFDVANFGGLGPNGYNAFSQNPFAHDVTGSIVKIAGSHSIKFGAEFRKIYSNFYQYGRPAGYYNVDQTWTQQNAQPTADGSGTGNSIASFLLGLAQSGYTEHTPSAASSSGYFATFVQDDWKVTRRLTANLGLRWDFEIPKTERFDKLSYWDPSVASPLNGGSVTPAPGVDCPNCGNLMGAMFFPGSTGKYGRRQGPTQYKDFAPRVGFAYDAGHGLVFRSGFGIVYAPSDLQAAGTSGGVGNQGFQSTTSYAPTFDNEVTINSTFADPYPANATSGQRYNLPQGAAGGPLTQVGGGISDSFFSSYRNPYNIQWNFSIQYALPGKTTLEASYLGNHGLFLIDGDPGVNFDQLPTSDLALGDALFTQVPNPFYGIINVPGSSLSNPTVQANQLLRKYPEYTGVQEFRKPTAESKYNAFSIRFNKHFSNGLSVLANFTGAKETDDSAAPVGFIGQVSSTRVNQYDPRAEWAVGPQDLSRVFSAGYVYELPFGRGKKFANTGGVLNRLVGGWETDGIIRWTTGTPVVLAGVGDPTGIFAGIGNGERPLWNGKSAKLSHPTHGEWFDTSVFSPLPQFTIGNAPRTIPNVRTPGLSNSDLSFAKNNYFGTDNRFNAQFRADLFNAFNHPRWGAPDANVNDANFGKITSIRNSSRQIQLAMKFIF
ncbi:MAG TPA: carboxypeptidase-like regulatory domain-containing protein [Terriglobales bacterium]|nr:carboxypeptidase-like regulatory domain-containing protein [Terriglobales bacterium]